MSNRAMSSWSSLRRLVPYSNPFSRSLRYGRDHTDHHHKPDVLHQVYDWKEYKTNYDPSLQFNIITFNMLAPVYKRLSSMNLETGNRKREAQSQELWRARAQKTLQFFREEIFPHTEILGMQEFWTDPQYRAIFDRDFQEFGYDVRVLQRTGSKLDAVVLAVKKDVFEVVDSLNVVLCSLSDRVALVLWLRHKTTGKSFIVANTHLSFPHSALDKINQLRQMTTLTNAMDTFADTKQVTNATRMIMGDFNVEYTSRVCEHLRSLGYISCFEVSSPLNPRCAPHSLDDPNVRPPRKRILRFVSHRNHRNEELGVDHIFIKAEKEEKNGVESLTVHGSHNMDDISHAEHNNRHSSDNVVDMHQIVVETKEGEGVQKEEERVDQNTSSSTVSLLSGVRMFVDNSRVLPLKVPCTDWETNFMVSDHRPVGATLIVAQLKNAATNSHHPVSGKDDHRHNGQDNQQYHVNSHSHTILQHPYQSNDAALRPRSNSNSNGAGGTSSDTNTNDNSHNGSSSDDNSKKPSSRPLKRYFSTSINSSTSSNSAGNNSSTDGNHENCMYANSSNHNDKNNKNNSTLEVADLATSSPLFSNSN